MATINYRGDYFTTAQVDTLTPGGTIEASDLFICTINGKALSVAAGGTTVASVTAAVTAAWNASTIPEFMEITATDSTTHITLTADTAGVPFTVTATTTETGGGAADAQTFVQATTTTATGPTTLTAANCEGGVLPGNSDTFYIPPGRSILYGLTALSGVTLTNLYCNGTYVGLPFWNVSGNGTYWEYRTTYLTLGATNVYIGHSEGTGVLRCKLNMGSVQTAAIVYDTGASADGNGFGAVQFKGTHNSNTLQVKGGSATVAKVLGESATIATLYVGSGDGSTTEPDVEIGAGATLTTTYCNGGYLETWSAITTMNVGGGVHEHQAGAVTTANVTDGTLYYNSTGTLTALNYVGGVVSTERDQRAKTFTTVNITVPVDGSTPAPYIRDPNGILTVTGYVYEPDGP